MNLICAIEKASILFTNLYHCNITRKCMELHFSINPFIFTDHLVYHFGSKRFPFFFVYHFKTKSFRQYMILIL